jgi:hypothetical protein
LRAEAQEWAKKGQEMTWMKAARDVFELNKFLCALSVNENENPVTASERNAFQDFPTPATRHLQSRLLSSSSLPKELIIYVMPFCLFIKTILE